MQLRPTVICAAAVVNAMASLGTAAAMGQTHFGSATIVVTITNAKLTLVPATALVGSVVFKILNRRMTARDFEIAGKRTPKIAEGRSSTLKVDFTQSGSYLYVSYGADHTAGLKGALRVVRASPPPSTKPAASAQACTQPRDVDRQRADAGSAGSRSRSRRFRAAWLGL